ncbi:MAG: hypothetical protein QXU89_02250 [Desulfurococcaceae archaeon]
MSETSIKPYRFIELSNESMNRALALNPLIVYYMNRVRKIRDRSHNCKQRRL